MRNHRFIISPCHFHSRFRSLIHHHFPISPSPYPSGPFCIRCSTIWLFPTSQHMYRRRETKALHAKWERRRKKEKEKLTIFPWRLLQPHATQMEPLSRTVLRITRHHLPIANTITVTVPLLILPTTPLLLFNSHLFVLVAAAAAASTTIAPIAIATAIVVVFLALLALLLPLFELLGRQCGGLRGESCALFVGALRRRRWDGICRGTIVGVG